MNAALDVDRLSLKLLDTNTPLQAGSEAQTLGKLEAQGDHMALCILRGNLADLRAAAEEWLKTRGVQP